MACCTETQLCERCHGRELASKVGQARVIGETWAEQVCRGERRQRAAWPELEPKTLAIARRLVGALAQDPRLLDELAVACSASVAGWWRRRRVRYRVEGDLPPTPDRS